MIDYPTIENIYNKILEYFKNHNITVITKEFNHNPSQDIVFNMLVQRAEIKRYYFSITYLKSLKTFVLFNLTMQFKPEDANALKSLKETNKAKHEQFFMDFRKMVYPLNVDFEITMPEFMLTKEVTLESCQNEQYFMDQVHNFLHAVELIRIAFDEFFYSMYPQGKPKDDGT